MAAKKPAKTEKAAPVTGAQEEKLKALEHALADLDKQFGKGAVMKLGEHAEQNVQVIPTGCLTLDEALGVGGIPRGRIVEIFGPESSGKTTVALHIVAQAQKMCPLLHHPGLCSGFRGHSFHLHFHQPDQVQLLRLLRIVL